MNRNRFYLLLLLVVILISVAGCDQHAKYKVLTFFFTGVPSPDDDKRKKEALKQLAENRKEPEKTFLSSHSFFSARKCTKCHQGSFTQRFRGSGAKPRPMFEGGGITGKLRVPLKEICVSCHKNKSAEYALANNLWLHAPVNKANCTVCHSPHRSINKALLKNRAEDLCVMCHSSGLIRMTQTHQESNKCTECHTSHLGKDKSLLIKDHKENTKLPDPSFDFPDR